MIKSLAPLGAFALCAASAGFNGADAAQCPSGQIYRVALHVCASKAANLKYMRGETKHASTAKLPPPAAQVAALRSTEPAGDDDASPLAYAPSSKSVDIVSAAATASSATANAQSRPPDTPFGALPPADRFMSEN